MNDEFLKSYQGLPTSLLNPTESIQPSALEEGCRFDTRDCAHDTCSSDCVDCSDSPTYTITATVNFDAVGGLVSPTSITEKGYGRTKPYGTVSIDFPKPTRDGYMFLYWLLDGYTTHWPAGTNHVYATSSGETYTARAQWEKQTAGKAFIGDGGVWKQAVPYIGDGGVWKPVSESIGDRGTWK